jgi:nicotinate-nucleotide pyrophosphorylase (carboxylating)
MTLPVNKSQLRKMLQSFLAEDIGSGDVTTNALAPRNLRARATLIPMEGGVLSGIEIVHEAFRILDPKLKWKVRCKDGQPFLPGRVIATVEGQARALLTGERVALNILQRMSGIATATRSYVSAVRGTRARILDTRKTIPGWRLLEKYAVRCGGGMNHRLDLSEAVLIKDNHIAIAGGIASAIRQVKEAVGPKIPCEAEVTRVSELREALRFEVERILLDNMTPQKVRQCIREIRRSRGGRRVIVECSGGITLENVHAYAAAGADWISVGALTHSARAVDISLEVEPCF